MKRDYNEGRQAMSKGTMASILCFIGLYLCRVAFPYPFSKGDPSLPWYFNYNIFAIASGAFFILALIRILVKTRRDKMQFDFSPAGSDVNKQAVKYFNQVFEAKKRTKIEKIAFAVVIPVIIFGLEYLYGLDDGYNATNIIVAVVVAIIISGWIVLMMVVSNNRYYKAFERIVSGDFTASKVTFVKKRTRRVSYTKYSASGFDEYLVYVKDNRGKIAPYNVLNDSVYDEISENDDFYIINYNGVKGFYDKHDLLSIKNDSELD